MEEDKGMMLIDDEERKDPVVKSKEILQSVFGEEEGASYDGDSSSDHGDDKNGN